jgi:outer membrane protein assembly factor BamB
MHINPRITGIRKIKGIAMTFPTIASITHYARRPNNMLRQMARGALLIGMLGLAGCSDDELILKGERISVLPERTVMTADAAAFDQGAGLPPVVNMAIAATVGLNFGHSGGHLQFKGSMKRKWSASIGGKGSALVDLAPPVVGDGRVYTVAPTGIVSAFDITNGKTIWSVSVETLDDDPYPGVGGGIAVSPEGIVVHSGGRNMALLDAADGTTKWSVTHDLPLRGGPTLIEDRAVIATDLDGNLLVYFLSNGELVWDRVGVTSDTIMFGTPSPAYANGGLVVAGARGEVTYFDADNGEMLWTDSIAAFNPRTPVEGIGDIRAHPVHDGGLVFVISQSGRIGAFSGRTGMLVWDQAIGGIEMPWLAGDTLFVMGLDGRLYALRRADGAVRWVAELPGALAPDIVVSETPPRFVGPVVAGNKVMVISKSGQIFFFDPDTGAQTSSKSLGFAVVTTPQVAAGKMFVLGSNGTLHAFE